MENLINRIFNIKNDFIEVAIDVFQYQSRKVKVYKAFIENLGVNPKKVTQLSQIPFLPIQFYKSHKVISDNLSHQKIFRSSGTTSLKEKSKHFVSDLKVYEKSIIQNFNNLIGDISTYDIIALLPSYTERDDASLIYMVNYLMKTSNSDVNAFYLNNWQDLQQTIIERKKKGRKILLFGVSFALIDFIEAGFKVDDSITIIETGGMKGRKKEMLKEQVLAILKKGFPNSRIISEYGMTELLSQAYALDGINFSYPAWFKILIRELEDPFAFMPLNKAGGVNIIDLANINACSFIATDDIGIKFSEDSFNILGRIDNSDIRGCSQLVV